MAGRQTRGRQRIPIRLIGNQDDLYATFSKRRLGLYKKASELSTLCGVDIGVIIFSPTDNPFSFFHPTMESVVDRYRNPNQPISDYARVVEAHTRARIDHLNRRLDEIQEEKDRLKEREKELDEIERNRAKGWWEETPVENLTQDQVREWKAWFRAFKNKVENRISELQNGASTSAAPPPAPPPQDADRSMTVFGQNYDFPPGPSSSSYAPPPPVVYGDQYATAQYYNAPPPFNLGGGSGPQYYVPQPGEGTSGSGGGGGGQYSVPYNYGIPPHAAEDLSTLAAGGSGGSGGQYPVPYNYGLPPHGVEDPAAAEAGQFPPIQYSYFPPPSAMGHDDDYHQDQDPSSSTGGVGQYSIQYNHVPRWGQDPSTGGGGGAGPSH